MGKKLLILACVVVLVGAVGISNLTAQVQQEIAYDDGGNEGFGIAGFVGDVIAVVFTPSQYPATLKQARVYIDLPQGFRLHVYDVTNINAGPGLDKIPGLVQLPTTGGWHTIDLSIYNITINSGDFAIGFEWLFNQDPVLLADESPPIDNRSWLWDGLNWNPVGQVIVGFNADLMIRATVEYPPTMTTTIPPPEECAGICCFCPILCGQGANSEETELLRTFRDEVLSKTAEGREIIKLYYQWGPLVARAMEADEEFKEEVTDIIEAFLPIARDSVE